MAKKKSKSSKKAKAGKREKPAKKREWDTTTIIQYTLLITAIVVFILVMAIGFKQKTDNQPPKIVNISYIPETANETAQEPEDMSLYDQMIGKASKVESYWYNFSDTDLDYHNMYAIRLRFGKILLENPEEINGNKYDLVYFDRVHKVAIARCSLDLCEEKDLDLDTVDYDKYYQNDPLEWMYKMKYPVYIGDEMLGNQAVKVFNITGPGNYPGKIWLMEFYGLPLKIEFGTENGTRKIAFNDLHVNTVTLGQIMLPINMTVDGKDYEFGWFGYLAKEFDEELKFS
ncbi:MAG: hypothetical protein KJ574_05195 [Nanoarchaeota archaeon]|nr:hypothetical protein [Nanoarchaeota archaeon]